MSLAAIYARYSSDLQSANSIEDQIRLCREHLEKEGISDVEVYTDYTLSDGSVKTRPRMNALLEDLRTRGIVVVMAEALDRVSRDQVDVAAIFERIRHAEARLVTIAEGEVSELHIGLKGTMNANNRPGRLSLRTRRPGQLPEALPVLGTGLSRSVRI